MRIIHQVLSDNYIKPCMFSISHYLEYLLQYLYYEYHLYFSYNDTDETLGIYLFPTWHKIIAVHAFVVITPWKWQKISTSVLTELMATVIKSFNFCSTSFESSRLKLKKLTRNFMEECRNLQKRKSHHITWRKHICSKNT